MKLFDFTGLFSSGIGSTTGSTLTQQQSQASQSQGLAQSLLSGAAIQAQINQTQSAQITQQNAYIQSSSYIPSNYVYVSPNQYQALQNHITQHSAYQFNQINPHGSYSPDDYKSFKSEDEWKDYILEQAEKIRYERHKKEFSGKFEDMLNE